MRHKGTVGITLATSLLLASLLTSTGSASVTTLLPSLTPALLLDIAQVDAPPAGVGLQVHADFPEKAPLLLDGLTIHSFTADLTPEGGVIVRNAVTSDHTGPDGVGECDDPTFVPTGVKWASGTMPIGWELNLGSTPQELDRPRTTLTMRSAHRIWPRAESRCSGGDKISFSYNYLGRTEREAKYDKHNVVDFGKLGQGALAANYTWYVGRDIVEVDLRLNKGDYKWTNIGEKYRYNVKNVVAHELGHQFGLDDLGSPHAGLTMYAVIGKGEVNKASLGRGDLKGASALSP